MNIKSFIFSALLLTSLLGCQKKTEEALPVSEEIGLAPTQSHVGSPTSGNDDAKLLDSGVHQDNSTNLIWMRCLIGQTWTGSDCTGEAIGLNWEDANNYSSLFINNQKGFANYKDWRLPSISELASLRHCRNGWRRNAEEVSKLTKEGRVTVQEYKDVIMVSVPEGTGVVAVPWCCNDEKENDYIDTNYFPTMGTKKMYWSSSSVVEDRELAWGVDFGCVNNSMDYNKRADRYVRLVRSSQ